MLLVTTCCVSISTFFLSSSAIWLNHSFSLQQVCQWTGSNSLYLSVIVFHRDAHLRLNSWNWTNSSGCCRLCSSLHVCSGRLDVNHKIFGMLQFGHSALSWWTWTKKAYAVILPLDVPASSDPTTKGITSPLPAEEKISILNFKCRFKYNCCIGNEMLE